MFLLFCFCRGLHPTVTQNGLCNDGCFQMETTFFDGKNQTSPNLVLFKGLMDDVDFFHDENDLFYVQMSYDLRNASARCVTPNGPQDLCLVKEVSFFFFFSFLKDRQGRD